MGCLLQDFPKVFQRTGIQLDLARPACHVTTLSACSAHWFNTPASYLLNTAPYPHLLHGHLRKTGSDSRQTAGMQHIFGVMKATTKSSSAPPHASPLPRPPHQCSSHRPSRIRTSDLHMTSLSRDSCSEEVLCHLGLWSRRAHPLQSRR